MAVNRQCAVTQFSVTLNLPDEFLVYEVTVSGGAGAFILVDTREQVILTSEGAPPRQVYTREWPSRPGDLPPDQASQLHVINFQFLAAVQYRFRVEKRRRSDGALIKEVKDCTYTADAPTDTDFDRLRVRFQGGTS